MLCAKRKRPGKRANKRTAAIGRWKKNRGNDYDKRKHGVCARDLGGLRDFARYRRPVIGDYMKQGQVSIEFMLLVVFVLVFLGTAVFPSLDLGVATVRDVRGIAESRVAAEKIANSLESLKGQGVAARETMTILVPQNGLISCDATPPNGIVFSFALNGPSVTACQNDDDANDSLCTKKFKVGFAFSCANFPIQGPQAASVVIQKSPANATVTRT